ncbi:MAG TPA: AAA family ATPase [Thermoanaerobaculia bacterium]|nr:AAA family ATPase [Thermoanaerobaculia bacterium]
MIPAWAQKLISLYESHAANQFLLYGNVNDQFLLGAKTPKEAGPTSAAGRAGLGSLYEFLTRVMLPRFDVVLSYDLGNGVRIDKGGEIVQRWPAYKESQELPRAPRAATEWLTRFFRYAANLARLGQESFQIGFYMKAAHLVAPALPGALNYDLSALALLMRDWATDDHLARHSLVTFLIADNLHDLHPLLVTNPRSAAIEVPLPSTEELRDSLELLAREHATALSEFSSTLDTLAHQLTGTTLTSIENLLRTRTHAKEPLHANDLVAMRKELVEKDSAGLIEFIESKRTLDDFHAQEKLKTWLRQDIKLWHMNDLQALPMGYLLCGPVGTGKTYLVECLAGEAGVPVVKLKNFRDKWVGSTEGNLEKIFRLLKGLGRCFVFIDEADQALGKRDAGTSDSGLSGRIYGMFAEQMSNPANRGRIVWILASSRPDLIEVDLKRPGRLDVKIPIFPATTASEGFTLIRALAKRRGIELQETDFASVEPLIPQLLTPGAAESIAVKLYRAVRTEGLSPVDALRDTLDGYQNPVPPDVMEFQISLAAREASDGDFVPEPFRRFRT